MRRRTAISLAIGAVAGIGIGIDAAGTSDVDTIAMVVRKRLDYLILEPQGVLRYARDLARLQVISSLRMRTLGTLAPVYRHFPLSSGHNALARKLGHGEDRIVGNYLISSDFFLNGADESRTVHYLGMLDPRHACGNPFARSPLEAPPDGSLIPDG